MQTEYNELSYRMWIHCSLTIFGLKINCKTLVTEEKQIRQAEAYKKDFLKSFSAGCGGLGAANSQTQQNKAICELGEI